jgi:hypothetical protein
MKEPDLRPSRSKNNKTYEQSETRHVMKYSGEMETREDQIERETRRLMDFQSGADDIARLIVSSDLPWVDIAIQIEQLRERAERLFPLKMDLFNLIYISRFHRLRQQWR